VRHLVAGGAGFIGSHVCDALLERGDYVTVVDNFSTGQRKNVAHLLEHENFTLLEHDVTRPLPNYAMIWKYDTILDLASPASPSDFATMPLEILDVGSTGTKNLLELALRCEAKFFLASTSEVYGDPLVHPQPESYLGNVSSIGPRSCYDEAKRFSEALTMAYHRVHDLDVRIVRIFNTYGERMRPHDGRVVNTFILQALKNEPLTVYGDGSQTRSFCHVEDEVKGLLSVLDGDACGPVNVGNPGEFTVLELAEMVIRATNSKSSIQILPLPDERDGDPLQRCPDISLIQSLYGWTPHITLAEGLERMIAWAVDAGWSRA
jgi:nucleoside-diphosphate-sugar epimerase